MNDEWDEIAQERGKRARRRETEALDPGHLRAWYDRQGWPDFDQVGLFKQMMRAFRHSCHSTHRGIERYIQRHANRMARQQVRQELKRINRVEQGDL